MKLVLEDGTPTNLDECPRLGYYRVCGDTLVQDQPYSTLSFYLRYLATCFGDKSCLNALLAKGRRALVKRASIDILQRMINLHYVEAGLSAEVDAPTTISLTRPYESSSFRRGYTLGFFELAAHRGGVTLAVRPHPESRRVYVPRMSPRGDKTPIEEAWSFLPALFLVSFELTTAFAQIEEATSVTTVSGEVRCMRGFQVDCYTYRGSRYCIYANSDGIAPPCPLRPITRKGMRTLGGALLWLKRAQDKLKRLYRHLPSDPARRLDLSLACYLVDYLSRNALDYAVASMSYMGGDARRLIEYYSELGLGECPAPPITIPPLRKLFDGIEGERRGSLEEGILKLRTGVIISNTNFPSKLLEIANLVETGWLYKYCKPVSLTPSQTRNLAIYIRTGVKILGDKSQTAAKAIARALEDKGCLEPEDLTAYADADIEIGYDLAVDVLDTLARRSILSKKVQGSRMVYHPTSYMYNFL